MASRVAPGTRITTTKRCPAHGIANGALVVVRKTSTMGNACTILCTVFASEADAAAAAAFLEHPSNEQKEAYDAAVARASDEMRIPFESASDSFGVKAWQRVAVTLGGDLPDGVEMDEDPLVGTEVGPAVIPVITSDGSLCAPAPKRFRIDAKDATCYTIVYNHEGETCTQRMRHGAVEAALKKAEGSEDFQITIPDGVIGSLRPLLKRLPASKELGDAKSCSGLELVTFIQRMHMSVNIGNASPQLRDTIILTKLAVIAERFDALPIDADREWPSSGPLRLADALYQAINGDGRSERPPAQRSGGTCPPPPAASQADRYPLYSAFKGLAATEKDFDAALFSSHQLNFKDRGDWGKDDPYVLRGGIERLFRGSKSFDRAAKIAANAPPGSLNQGELRALLDDAAAEQKSSAGASSSDISGARGEQTNAKFEFNGKSISSSDAAQAAQVRIDAQQIACNPALSAALGETMEVAITNPSGLGKHIREIEAPEIKRICASTVDLPNVLNGTRH